MPRKIPVTPRQIEDMVKRGETMFDIFHKYGIDVRELFRLGKGFRRAEGSSLPTPRSSPGTFPGGTFRGHSYFE